MNVTEPPAPSAAIPTISQAIQNAVIILALNGAAMLPVLMFA